MRSIEKLGEKMIERSVLEKKKDKDEESEEIKEEKKGMILETSAEKNENSIEIKGIRITEKKKKEISEIFAEVKEQEELTDEEKKVLVLLELVSKNKNGLKITGFQIKDFLELIFPEIDVDAVYSQLKEKDLISKQKDSEEFWLTYKGEEIAKKCEELKRPILEKVTHLLESVLEENELLKRMLYLSYLDEWKFRIYYLPKIKEMLTEKQQMLCVFICNREFLQLPSVEKLVRRIRKEELPLLQKELEELCKDVDFLRVLFILKLDELKDKLGLNIEFSLYYRNYIEGLSNFIEKSKVNKIISKLLLLGIIDSENLFNLDIEKILLREENLRKFKEMISFDENELEKEIKSDWDLFVDLKRMLEGYTPFHLEKFIKMNVVLLSKDRILVRSELRKIYEKIVNYIEIKLKEKIGYISNVVILPFYDRDKIKELEEKIIIILEGDIDDEHILERNVILKVSPKEIGMETTRKKNEEYNAVGEIEYLESVKERFNLCKWIKVEDNYYVKRAKEIVEKRKNPPISLEKALEELKEDFRLIEMLYLISDKHTGITAIRDRKYYGEHDLWADVWRNMKKLYPNLTEDEFSKLKEKLISVIKKTKRNILLDFFHEEKKIISEKFKEEFVKKIKERIATLDKSSKQAIFLFLLLLPEFPNEIKNDAWKCKFKLIYELMFKEKLKVELKEILLKVGLVNVGTWYSSNYYSPSIDNEDYNFFHLIQQIKDNLKEYLRRELGDVETKIRKVITSFKEKFQDNLTQLIGLDFLTQKGGYCKKEELRNFLWNISLKAWEEFKSFEGIISPKDEEIITINPLVIEKIRKFVKSKKKEITEKTSKELIEILRFSEDFGIDITFDEELSIYRGIIRTREGEEITLIIAPWYLPQYENLLGRKTLLIITSQPDYHQFSKFLKQRSEEIILLFVKGKDIFVYSSFENNSFTKSLLQLFLEKDYNLKKKELEFEELEKLEEEEKKKTEKYEIPESVIERDILDEIFPPLGEKGFSSLFDTTGKPKCIVLVGKGEGKKIIEDLLKKELEYWGISTSLIKQLEVIKKGEERRSKTKNMEDIELLEDPKEIINYISNPKYRIVAITLHPELLEWIEKIVEKLKEVETQGLKYVVFHIPLEGLPEEVKNKIEGKSSIPIYIIGLLKGEGILRAKSKLLEFFGEGIRVTSEFESLDSWWNSLQREIEELQRRMKEKVFGDEDITFEKLDNETTFHYLMKALVYKYLKLRGYEVRVEEPHTVEDKVKIPDLVAYKKEKEILVEIETGYPTKEEKEEYGEIINPEERMMSEKKLGKHKNSNVILVVPNLFGIIHRRMLKRLKGYFKTKRNVNLSVYTIDWSSYPYRLIKLV